MKLCAYASCPHDAAVTVENHDLCAGHAMRYHEEKAPRPSPTPAPRPAITQALTELPTRVLTAHPDNVRDDLGDLTEMTASVRAQGILQPLLITRSTDQRGTYLVIAGHRRLAAATAAGLPRVPVRLREQLVGTDAIEAMLVENLQRKDLDPLEEANAYDTLVKAGRSQAQVARAVGLPEPRISARLALLNLTPAEQDALRRREITVNEAYKTGRERSSRRIQGARRGKPRRVPHFTIQHPLAETAGGRCEHESTLKLGIACGPCWEQAIRDDERHRTPRGVGAA